MDPRHLAIDERLKTDTCVYCHRKANTRDHVPSRVLLDEPYPPQLPTVDACEKCNTGFSSDEEYLSCFIECVLCGATEPGSLRRPKVKRILHEKPKLREQIQESLTRDGDRSVILVFLRMRSISPVSLSASYAAPRNRAAFGGRK